MVNGTLDEVMLKEISNLRPDRVIIVRNLPKHFLYTEQVKQVMKVDRDGYVIDARVPDPKGEKEVVLKEGLEHSRNGDGSIVLNTRRQHVKTILADIMQYVQGTLPRDIRVPEMVEYSSQRGNMMANPIPVSRIPAIDLPKIDRAEPKEISPAGNAASPKPARVLTDEQKAKRAAILAKARAARAAKKAAKENQ